jgi:orotate phosphoribosyltransferase
MRPPAAPRGPLDAAAVLGLLERAGALRRGHFELSSGRHSDVYLQCALVLQWPTLAEALGRAMAAPWTGKVDVVVGPAMGGVVIGHEVARALGVRLQFSERSAGAMTLRRSFGLAAGERALVVEDVVTTAASAMEVARLIERAGAEVAGLAAIVDRGPGAGRPGQPRAGGRRLLDGSPVELRALVRMEAPAWDPAACPRCAAGEPVHAPGSRRLTGGGG